MLHNNSRKRKEESKICKLNYFHLSAILKKKKKKISQKFRILFKKTQMNPPRESPFHPLHNRTIVQPISESLQRLAKNFYIVLVSLGIQVQVQLLKDSKN